MQNRFSINEKRLRWLATFLTEKWRTRAFPYDQATRPQDTKIGASLRQKSELEQSLFWFYTCLYMSGGIKSNDATVSLWNVREKNPEIFNPFFFSESKMEYPELVEYVEGAIGKKLPYYLLKRKRQWVENSLRIAKVFNGDPRKIFASGNYFVAESLMRNDFNGGGFLGFQEKMAGMLTYFLIQQGLIELDEYISAVDFHLLRVLISSGAIEVENPEVPFSYGQVYPVGKFALWLGALDEKGVMSPEMMTDFADALWLLSTELCSASPINARPDLRHVVKERVAKNHERRGLEQLKQPTQLSLGLEDSFSRDEWLRRPKQRRRIEASCHRCPLKFQCRTGIPAQNYYQGSGMFVLLDM